MASTPAPKGKNPIIARGRKGILNVIFSRMGVIFLLLLLQIGAVFALYYRFGNYWPHFYGAAEALSVVMAIYLINTDSAAYYKTTWLVFLLLAPVAAVPFYFYLQLDVGHRALMHRLRRIAKESLNAIPLTGAERRLAEESPADARLSHYLRTMDGFPVYDATGVTYYPTGEDFFSALLEALRQAREFIFMEYFIIEPGVMWDQVVELLAEKADKGVDVRLLFDGTCEVFRVPRHYADDLRAKNIQCHVFAPIRPFVSTHYNYRDHRKITVVDGTVAFTGGINLADEYINAIHPFGRWKDTALRLEGEGVKTFTLLFLQMWQIDQKELSFEPYLSTAKPLPSATGYVIPYGDHPLDKELLGEQVYLHILNSATRYVHIMTPYLILDSEMESALKFAAKRGVDVTLLLPHIPDKRIPFALAKGHYPALIAAGVKIFEYTPGFLHAKSFVSDDRRAVVGSINLDYRSLCHHFECAAYLYNVPCVADIEADFQRTLKQSQAISRHQAAHPGAFYWIVGRLMKVFAPLM